MSNRGDDQAYPCAGFEGPDSSGPGLPSMTIRERIAMAVAAGMFADPAYQLASEHQKFPEDIVLDSIRVADALLAELEK